MWLNKLWVLIAVSFLAGLLAAWFIPKGPIRDQFEHFIPFVMYGLLALSLLMYVVASRLGRRDVTIVERFARRMLFKQSPPN